MENIPSYKDHTIECTISEIFKEVAENRIAWTPLEGEPNAYTLHSGTYDSENARQVASLVISATQLQLLQSTTGDVVTFTCTVYLDNYPLASKKILNIFTPSR